MYFCCLEALQNAGKHAGEGASITVTITGDERAPRLLGRRQRRRASTRRWPRSGPRLRQHARPARRDRRHADRRERARFGDAHRRDASRWNTTVDRVDRLRRGGRRCGPNGLVAAVTLAARRLARARSSRGSPSRAAVSGPRSSRCPGTCTTCARPSTPSRSASQALRELPLAEHGLEWVHPDVPLAHPLDGGRVALLHRSVDETAAGLGVDGDAYRRLITPFVWQDARGRSPRPDQRSARAPIPLARYGLVGIRSAVGLAESRFRTDEAAALFAGGSAHSMLSLRSRPTAGYGLLIGVLGHLVGWPMAKGGSGAISAAPDLDPRGAGRQGRVRPSGAVTRRAPVCPRDPARRHPAAAGGDRGRPAARAVPPRGSSRSGTGPASGRSTGRWTARRRGRTPTRPRGDGPPRWHAGRDRRRRGARCSADVIPSGRSCCSSSRRRSITRGHRRGCTRRGPTATSPTAPSST